MVYLWKQAESPIIVIYRKDVITNSLGEIITDKEGKTNIPGLFAAGDVTDNKNKQVIIAAGEGAVAALTAHDYLLRN